MYGDHETPSSPLAKAFPANVQRDRYETVVLTTTKPSGDGVVSFGDGASVPRRILLFPFCEGQAGDAFWLCLYGWRPVEGLRGAKVWLWYVLAEFLCVAGEIPGPQLASAPGPGGYGLPVSPVDRVCDALAPTRWVPGETGFVNSAAPGSGAPAFAGVELLGSQLVSFDFAQVQGGRCAANCLWARG